MKILSENPTEPKPQHETFTSPTSHSLYGILGPNVKIISDSVALSELRPLSEFRVEAVNIGVASTQMVVHGIKAQRFLLTE